MSQFQRICALAIVCLVLLSGCCSSPTERAVSASDLVGTYVYTEGVYTATLELKSNGRFLITNVKDSSGGGEWTLSKGVLDFNYSRSKSLGGWYVTDDIDTGGFAIVGGDYVGECIDYFHRVGP